MIQIATMATKQMIAAITNNAIERGILQEKGTLEPAAKLEGEAEVKEVGAILGVGVGAVWVGTVTFFDEWEGDFNH